MKAEKEKSLSTTLVRGSTNFEWFHVKSADEERPKEDQKIPYI